MILTTERLVLREFDDADWPAVLAYQSDPRYLRFYPWTERTAFEVREFVRMFLAWRDEQPRTRFQFAITLPGDGTLIGNCGIRLLAPGAQEADLGYELDPRYWGSGYATEAAQAMLSLGFQNPSIHRIGARCIAENTASARVLEKIGMRQEGHLREKEWMQERWWDTLLYAILDHEWRGVSRT